MKREGGCVIIEMYRQRKRGNVMIRIVTVEDEESAANILKKHAERYNSENGKKLSITEYRDLLSFLANYKSDADLIFMDIKMPGMDGLTCAHRLRKTDSSVHPRVRDGHGAVCDRRIFGGGDGFHRQAHHL